MYDPKPIDMSEALRQVYEGKKLDPVGQEDKDIDNDGDHDKSDKYLLNRRKVRGAAIKTRKEEVEEFVDSLDEEQLEYVLEFIGGKKGDGYIGHPNLDIKNPLAKTQTKGPVGNKTGSGLVHRVGGALGDRKMKMDAMMKGLSKGGPVKKEEVIHDLSQLDEEQLDEIISALAKNPSVFKGTPAAKTYNKSSSNVKNAVQGVAASMSGGKPGNSMTTGRPNVASTLKQNFSKDQLKTGGQAFKGYMTGAKKGPGSNFNLDRFLTGKSAGGQVKSRKEAFDYLDDNVDAILEWFDDEGVDAEALTEEQLNEIIGGLVGGLMNMGKKGGFVKGATTGIGGLAGKALGKRGHGLLGFSKGGEKKKVKKEALAFSAEEELFIEQCDFDAVTDEELVAFFEDAIVELAEDDQDLLEICEELELCGILMEEEERDAGAEARERLKDKKKPSNLERLKAAAAKAGERLKKGAKAVIGAGARAAGHAAGEFQAQRKKSKKAAMQRGDGEKKKSDDDGDKTGGKLDDILSSIRNDARGTSNSGGGSSSASSGGGGSKKPSFIQRVGSALKGALKKGVGKLSRAVSKGSDRLATRLGEDYEQIAHLYDSGLFTIQEIENVIEEGYKEISKKKENEMYRKAGNLARKSLSSNDPDEKEKARKKSAKIVSAIARQKENERFKKMGDHKARDNYEG